MAKHLSRLLTPRTIAVIGGKEAERVVEQCDKMGFAGTIWPVNPKRDTIRGRPCFTSIDDLPEPPDAAYVAVNRERSIDMVAALSKMGAGGVVCYAAGFAEADAENEGSGDLQRRLVQAAGDMPIIGPNCYGFINALEGVALWPDQHGAVRCESGVAILTQSSNIAINLTMQTRGLPIAYVMTVGNQAQTGLSEIALGLLEDDRVTALGLHIEGLDDVKAFERLALRARELKKPVTAIKVGKSEQAQAAALTHTASLAGSDVAHEALFKRLGVARVHTLEAFVETLKLLHCVGPLPGNDILSMSCSGGEASLMADAAEGRVVRYRAFDEAEKKPVKDALGDIVTVANPLDYNTFIWGDWPGMIRMFEAALEPRFDLSLLVMDYPRDDRCDPSDWDNATGSYVAAVKQIGARAAIVASLPETMPERVANYLMSVGIAPLCGLENSVIAAEAAAFIGDAWTGLVPVPLLSPLPPTCHSRNSGNPEPHMQSSSDAALDHRRSGDDNVLVLDEYASKLELATSGLVVPKSVVITNADSIPTTGLTPPYALKALGIAHKSEAGAVHLGLSGETDIAKALEAMKDLSNSFLLEEMAPKPLAELIVGITRDPVVGLVMTIGAGGVLTELLGDTASLLLPATEADVSEALAGLKISKLLNGYRDTEAADTNALIANVLCIANYATEHADTLEELDVNPLFATQSGSIAVDALIVKRKTS